MSSSLSISPFIRKLVSVLFVCALAFAPAARAELTATPKNDSDKPWSKGVSEARKLKAFEAFKQGNMLLKDSVFVHAANSYREALKHWDHPAIHYNLVLALLNLDQPVEIYEHLEAAMKYGPDPLDAEKFEQARAYKAIFAKQISRVDISCDVPGVRVRMDGRDLFIGPGRYQALVRAGPHTIVATKQGFVTNEISRALPAGELSTIKLNMYTTEEVTRYRRPFPEWIQWTAIAGGAAIAGGGGLLHLQARETFRSYDKSIQDCAAANPTQGGCIATEAMQGQLSRGRLTQLGAFAGYGLGGALVAGGTVLMLLNTATPYRITPEELEKERGGPSVSAAPILAPGVGGLSVVGTF